MRLRRLVRLGFLAAAAGTVLALKANDWDLTSFGLVRFGRAAITVANISIDYKWTLYDMDTKSAIYKETLSKLHSRSAKKLLDLCCINGGSFIKVGQHIGSMDYLLPDEYVDTMKTLYYKAPKSSVEDILSVVRMELNQEPSDLFQCFHREPIGAASLAQVHKAVLKCGRTVAVKVQHPHVRSRSYVDMKTMELLVNVVAKLFPEFKFRWLSEEMKKNLPKELDFLNEGKNAEKMAGIFSKYDWLKIPTIYWKLSTPRVLTMEYCEGGQIDDRNYITKHKIDANVVSDLLGKLYSEMIFVQGVVHCDPHPGNLYVSLVDKKPMITLLDHGLYRILSDDFRIRYSKLWLAILNADVYKIKKHSNALGCGALYGVLASMVTARSWKSVTEGITKSESTSEEERHIQTHAARYLPQITEVLELVPRDMILILKTNDLLRAVERSLTRRPAKVSFERMSRCCLKAVYDDKWKECNTFLCQCKETIYYIWVQIKLLFHELVHIQFVENGCAVIKSVRHQPL